METQRKMRKKNTRLQGDRIHSNRLHIRGWRDERVGGRNEDKGQDRFGSPTSEGNN